jgi:hypothetical protein
MMQEHITHGLGALNDEGAFTVSSPLVSEEFSNADGLRARQQDGQRRQSSRLRLSTLAAGRRFRRSDPLRPRFGALEKGQLATGAIILMLQLLELRLEVGLLLLVQRGTFLTGELHPIATVLGSFDPLFQRFAQLLRPHGKE